MSLGNIMTLFVYLFVRGSISGPFARVCTRTLEKVFPRVASVTALLEALADLGRWKDALQELRALSASGVKVGDIKKSGRKMKFRGGGVVKPRKRNGAYLRSLRSPFLK